MAGRFQRGPTRDLLSDASGSIAVVANRPRPGHGDQVAGHLIRSDHGYELRNVVVLTPARGELGAELRTLADRRPALAARAAVLDAIRSFFRQLGFLEVETPTRVHNPGLEPHLRPFAAGSGHDGQPRYLITSPELHLKRLLAAGYERVFELARAFRDEELGNHHASEFTLLEWYRTHAGLADLAADLTALLPRVARAAGRNPTQIAGCDLSQEPERLRYAEAFRRATGTEPWRLDPGARERRFVAEVEPSLGHGRPALLVEFPPDQAALARLVRPEDGGGWPRVAARMELYVAGVELANGFDELTDPDEQRRRHQCDQATRQSAGAAVPPLDEGFLAALESGIPPSAGMALGVDRLTMVLLGARSIHEVRAFG